MGKPRKFRDDPLVKLCREHGYLTVQRGLNFVVAWAYCARKIGHDPTITEYIEFWKANRSSAFREQQAFRKVTGLDTPRPILDSMARSGVVVDERPQPTDGFVVVPFLVPA